MKNDSEEFIKNNNRQYIPLGGCFPFYLPVFLHFFILGTKHHVIFSGSADGRIFLKCCQWTMMNRLLPVDYMSNYRVDCMHPGLTYGIRRTKRYHVHGNRQEPNEPKICFFICRWETNFVIFFVFSSVKLFSNCINIIMQNFWIIFWKIIF